MAYFFKGLGSIVNVLAFSAKCLSQLKSICQTDLDLIASGDVQIGIGVNQI